MAARIALARKRARQLVQAADISTAPVPIEKLAHQIGAVIRMEPFDGRLSGMVHRQADGTAVIGINRKQSVYRRRFTIAHELGHLLLHEDKLLHVDERFPIGFRTGISGFAIDSKEIEANQFAAELLMPESFLLKDIGQVQEDLDIEEVIERLSQIYDVSREAMAIRLSALNLIR